MRPIITELWISPRPATETNEDWVFTVVGESDSNRSEEQDVLWQVHVYDPESGDERRFDGGAGLVEFAEGILAAARPKAADPRDPRYHGILCPKAPHTGEGYLHGEHDDRPYLVDGLEYCGRCHGSIDP